MSQKFIDVHCHGFPNRLFDAIWAYFDKNYWKIYKKYYAKDIISFLSDKGAMYFNLLNYAHKPNISRDLNDWSSNIAKKSSKIISFGTIHPEDPYFEDELDRILSPEQLNLKGIKLQLMVTNFDPTIQILSKMYEKLLEYEKILILHVGTGPIPSQILNTNLQMSPHVGISKLTPVLNSFPKLKLQVPHLGCMESNDFFDLAKNYPNFYFDTAMALEFIIEESKKSKEIDLDFTLENMLEIQDRIMFGSDFPNIPYEYSHSLNAINELPIDNAIKEKILFENARVFYELK
jgi:uncharacterized protein